MKKISIFTLLLFAMISAASAQPGFEDDVDDVPIDGGISILAGSAIAYGLKRGAKVVNTKKEDYIN